MTDFLSDTELAKQRAIVAGRTCDKCVWYCENVSSGDSNDNPPGLCQVAPPKGRFDEDGIESQGLWAMVYDSDTCSHWTQYAPAVRLPIAGPCCHGCGREFGNEAVMGAPNRPLCFECDAVEKSTGLKFPTDS